MKLKTIISLSLVVIVLAASYYGYSIYTKIFSVNTSIDDHEVFINIPSDANFNKVTEILAPYLSDTKTFELTADKAGYIQNIRPGKFLIKKGMNNYEIITSLRVNIPVKLTFNNQETLEDFAGRIAQQIEPDSLTILKTLTSQSFLEKNEFTPETILSMFIPNTYEFYWNTTAVQFGDKMAKEYRRFWNDDRKAKAAALNLTPQQVSILASIVHKETVKIDERPRVAGVYLNRLENGMPLQADPTVIYAIKKNANDFTQVIKRVMQHHLLVDSPYNTYKIQGLPPGPIAMPDVSAIDAVLNYEKHDYLYFCASVERFGYHEFAKNLAQHNVNSAKYHRWVKQQGY